MAQERPRTPHAAKPQGMALAAQAGLHSAATAPLRPQPTLTHASMIQHDGGLLGAGVEQTTPAHPHMRRSLEDATMNRKSLLLLAPLLTISLLSSQVAGAADAPCQGWGKATFVYEVDVVEACLDTAIDVNAGINRSGKTPLIGATQLGDSDAVWLLLAAGANPNKQDRQEWTPLMFAAQAGHQEIARQLATAGADPHIRNAAGKTAILLALEHEQTAMLGPLAAAGAAIDAATLVWVIEQGQHTLIPALAAAGVNLHIRLAGGATLLMRAARARSAGRGRAATCRRPRSQSSRSDRGDRITPRGGGWPPRSRCLSLAALW